MKPAVQIASTGTPASTRTAAQPDGKPESCTEASG